MEIGTEAYRAILEALPTGAYLVDPDRRIILWSKGAEELTGFHAQEVVGRRCGDDILMHCDDTARCLCGDACPLQETMHDGNPRTTDAFLLHKEGHRVPVRIHAAPLHDRHGEIVGAIECFDRRVIWPTADPAASRLVSFAVQPKALPERDTVEMLLAEYLQNYEAFGIPFGVICIAVDSLDSVRRTKGWEAVHAVFLATGRTFAGALGPNDMIGRWAEEQFIGVIAGCSTASLKRAAYSVNRLVESMAVRWWGDRIPVDVSVGGTIVQTGDSLESLVRRAEQALQSSLAESEHIFIV